MLKQAHVMTMVNGLKSGMWEGHAQVQARALQRHKPFLLLKVHTSALLLYQICYTPIVSTYCILHPAAAMNLAMQVVMGPVGWLYCPRDQA